MAPVQWSDLPGGILEMIAKLADSDIDLLRLRSVCSPWRSSLSPPPQRKPLTFPLKLPPVRSELTCFNERRGCYKAKDGFYKLHEDTLYRLSSPQDPSNGWMFKASESSNPNTFSLLIPLTNEKLQYPPETIPNHLNLLEYQISEISKSYRLEGVNCDGFPTEIMTIRTLKKLFTLFNYVVDCGFLALGLKYEGDLIYWKIGVESWTPVDTKGHKIHDVVFCGGRCYAIDSKGVLVLFNSKLQLEVVASSTSSNHVQGQRHYLVKCDSDLYLASKKFGIVPGLGRWNLDEVTLSKFNGNWDCVEDLGDKVFLLSDDGESVGVSAKDFQGCKGNRVYLSEFIFHDSNDSEVYLNESQVTQVYGEDAIIYHLDTRKAVKMEANGDSRKLYWPPPSWLMH